MGRLIDADRLKAHYCWWAGGSKEMSIDEAKKTFDTIIDLQPEEVVRCKDCIDATYGEYGLECNYHGRDVGENDYCSWGERKEDETD